MHKQQQKKKTFVRLNRHDNNISKQKRRKKDTFKVFCLDTFQKSGKLVTNNETTAKNNGLAATDLADYH